MDDDAFNMYAQYTFVVGFVVPFFLMTVCYILLVRHVRAKFRNRKVAVSSSKTLREPRYMHEMRKSIWRIAVFHFVCWAPFWVFAIVPHYIAQLWGPAFLERLPGWAFTKKSNGSVGGHPGVILTYCGIQLLTPLVQRVLTKRIKELADTINFRPCVGFYNLQTQAKLGAPNMLLLFNKLFL
ncbi:unnamed protein product [Heligmosomoides polygyrus]|uniref:G_PROTEIN_RECEP_F1_2 domain-containing protein n=1 Tax=Heligmosomoides polygyrus TaxID=6339 RepID=A0A183GN54_HELPZ|nr:unnamed protein product [Heligmosomoides polygyrus]